MATMEPTSYAASVGNDLTDSTTGLHNDGLGNGMMFRKSGIRLAVITDRTSQTIVVGERAWCISSGPWAGVVTNGVILAPRPVPSEVEAKARLLQPEQHHGNLIP